MFCGTLCGVSPYPDNISQTVKKQTYLRRLLAYPQYIAQMPGERLSCDTCHRSFANAGNLANHRKRCVHMSQHARPGNLQPSPACVSTEHTAADLFPWQNANAELAQKRKVIYLISSVYIAGIICRLHRLRVKSSHLGRPEQIWCGLSWKSRRVSASGCKTE